MKVSKGFDELSEFQQWVVVNVSKRTTDDILANMSESGELEFDMTINGVDVDPLAMLIEIESVIDDLIDDRAHEIVEKKYGAVVDKIASMAYDVENFENVIKDHVFDLSKDAELFIITNAYGTEVMDVKHLSEEQADTMLEQYMDDADSVMPSPFWTVYFVYHVDYKWHADIYTTRGDTDAS